MQAQVSNVYSKVVEYKWNFDGDTTWDTTIVSSDSTIACSHVYKDENIFNVIVCAVDDSGMVKYASDTITVKNANSEIKQLTVSSDTISIFDSVTFLLEAVENDGQIVKVEWNFDGDSQFDDTIAVGSDSVMVNIGWRYEAADTYAVLVRLTDDDGKETDTTISVVVLQDIPVITFFNNDTIIEYGGTIQCSVVVHQEFGTFTVEIDTNKTGNWISVADNEIYAVKNIATGNACLWDSVKVRITDDDVNIVDTAFKVDILPRPLSITSIDSTKNTLTVNYSRTQESDFAEYRIYRDTTSTVDTNSELWATITTGSTTSHSIVPSCEWIPRYYRVYQKDGEGLWSAGSNIIYGNIVNSPPSTPVITCPANDGDSIWSNEVLRWTKCTDVNNHTVKYRVLINYNNTVFIEFATEVADTFVMLDGYDSLGFAFKVIAYDSEGDSSAWSDEMAAIIRNTVIDIDGNVYRLVRIGTQLWTVENLKTTRYNDGTPIPLVTDSTAWADLTTPGYCWYNNDSALYANKYGALYNWYAVDTKQLAPAGWHVPDMEDWNNLEIYLIANGYNWDGTTTGNKIAKSMAAKTDWNSSVTAGHVGNDLSSNNSTGFSVLPGGYRYGNGGFYGIGGGGDWWSATELDASTAYGRDLYYYVYYLFRSSNFKGYGFSVRLLRDVDYFL